MLLGDEVAIVTDIEGTTRDVIESTLSLGGVTLNLADTAGIRATEDRVEKIGVERALSKIESSELLLCVFDLSRQETAEDYEILDAIKDKCAIAILNKSDTPPAISKEFEEKIRKTVPYLVYISARDKTGYEELAKAVAEIYELGKIDISNDAIISNARQLSSVSLALDEAKDAMTAFTLGATNDIVCTYLENALAHLDMIDARGVSEEVVNAIFSRFCVGK
jgi:tRNA modification GTPase